MHGRVLRQLASADPAAGTPVGVEADALDALDAQCRAELEGLLSGIGEQIGASVRDDDHFVHDRG